MTVMETSIWEKVQMVRKRKFITQEELSGLSDVSYGSIKRFEASGRITLLSLTKIAMALDCTDELRNIFTKFPYWDMQELIDNSN